MTTTRGRLLACSLLLPLALIAGCSSPSEPADEAAAAAGGLESSCGELAPPVAVDGPLSGSGLGGVLVTGDPGGVPTVVVENGAAPAAELGSLDLEPGTGPEAKAGDTLTVDYCGVGLASGAVFDSSWARGEPATFPLDGLIPGWQQGLPGMKEGGRRLLVIPGALAYGANPPGGSGIQPDETLAFVIDLKRVS